MLRLTFAQKNLTPGENRLRETSCISTRPANEVLEIIICDSKVIEVRTKSPVPSEAAESFDSN